jgi:hypothetical protein
MKRLLFSSMCMLSTVLGAALLTPSSATGASRSDPECSDWDTHQDPQCDCLVWDSGPPYPWGNRTPEEAAEDAVEAACDDLVGEIRDLYEMYCYIPENGYFLEPNESPCANICDTGTYHYSFLWGCDLEYVVQ